MRARHVIRGVLFALGCVGCDLLDCGTTKMAELIEAQGEVSRDFAASVGEWRPASRGDTFDRGDGLRTGAAASALLRVGKRGRARVEADTTIRFFGAATAQTSSGTETAPVTGVEVERGQAQIDVGDAQLELQTRAGRAVFRPGSRVVLQKAGEGTRYRVMVGSATFSEAGGRQVSVAAGQSIAVGIGLAVLDPVEVAPAPKPSAEAAPRDQPASGAADAGALATTSTRPEARIDELDLKVAAGESFRVYDPKPPTAIGFDFGARCPQGGELAVEGIPPVRARRVAVALVDPGIRPYAVRCVEGDATGKTVAKGIVRVLRGDGARPLPKSAPRNAVELDGRRYNLMYQNLRPIVTVDWPDAPASPSYSFALRTPAGATKSWKTSEPRFVVQPDVLEDGAHTVSMQTTGKPVQRSKETVIDVSFDNATPTASLELPRPEGFGAAGEVRVAGVAIEGSSISVDGRAIPTDRAHRFAATVPLSADQRTLAIRFQHATRGIRYYLRRAIGAAR